MEGASGNGDCDLAPNRALIFPPMRRGVTLLLGNLERATTETRAGGAEKIIQNGKSRRACSI